MSAVFISYRRSGSKHAAYRLKDKLKQSFGADKVFIDLEDIDAGLPFADVIRDTISRCSVVLVVIGPRWLEMQDMQGSRRLDAVDDWVRQEIEAAMASDARVIPVLVDGAPELKVDQVPDSLREFAGLQAMRLSEEETYWNFDIDRLIAKIEAADPGLKKEEAGKPETRFSAKVIAALVIAVLLFVMIGLEQEALDQDSVIALIVFAVVALALSIWGYLDVQAERARGRNAAIGSIVLASVVAPAAIGSLPDPDVMAPVPGIATGLQSGGESFDPNTLPPTASIPPAAQTVDISGAWQGADGSRYTVTQYGNRFEFIEFGSSGDITATGTGVIRGSLIESEFKASDNTWGSGRLQLSGDGQTLSGSYTNAATGETFGALLSRR
jgi:hypothetical protein